MKKLLHDVQVELTVELGSASIQGSDLMNIEIGDVIMLDNEADKPLFVKVEGVPKLRATGGICHGNMAFQVHSEILNIE
jgi:flagellar motor switch protein FliM